MLYLIQYDHPDHGSCFVHNSDGVIKVWGSMPSSAMIGDEVLADMIANGDSEDDAASMLATSEFGVIELPDSPNA